MVETAGVVVVEVVEEDTVDNTGDTLVSALVEKSVPDDRLVELVVLLVDALNEVS